MSAGVCAKPCRCCVSDAARMDAVGRAADAVALEARWYVFAHRAVTVSQRFAMGLDVVMRLVGQVEGASHMGDAAASADGNHDNDGGGAASLRPLPPAVRSAVSAGAGAEAWDLRDMVAAVSRHRLVAGGEAGAPDGRSRPAALIECPLLLGRLLQQAREGVEAALASWDSVGLAAAVAHAAALHLPVPARAAALATLPQHELSLVHLQTAVEAGDWDGAVDATARLKAPQFAAEVAAASAASAAAAAGGAPPLLRYGVPAWSPNHVLRLLAVAGGRASAGTTVAAAGSRGGDGGGGGHDEADAGDDAADSEMREAAEAASAWCTSAQPWPLLVTSVGDVRACADLTYQLDCVIGRIATGYPHVAVAHVAQACATSEALREEALLRLLVLLWWHSQPLVVASSLASSAALNALWRCAYVVLHAAGPMAGSRAADAWEAAARCLVECEPASRHLLRRLHLAALGVGTAPVAAAPGASGMAGHVSATEALFGVWAGLVG